MFQFVRTPYLGAIRDVRSNQTFVERQFSYGAYCGWREIPQTDVRIGQQPTLQYPF